MSSSQDRRARDLAHRLRALADQLDPPPHRHLDARDRAERLGWRVIDDRRTRDD